GAGRSVLVQSPEVDAAHAIGAEGFGHFDPPPQHLVLLIERKARMKVDSFAVSRSWSALPIHFEQRTTSFESRLTMFLFHIVRNSIHLIPNSRDATSQAWPKSWLISSLIMETRNDDAADSASA